MPPLPLASPPLQPCPPAYKAYASNCPARMVLDRLDDQWVLRVNGRLKNGTLRFNPQRRGAEGVSQQACDAHHDDPLAQQGA